MTYLTTDAGVEYVVAGFSPRSAFAHEERGLKRAKEGATFVVVSLPPRGVAETAHRPPRRLLPSRPRREVFSHCEYNQKFGNVILSFFELLSRFFLMFNVFD